jgi:DNA-binding response OmpR family regulator
MASAQTAPTILFIDDDDDLVAALSCALEQAGYAVRRASNGDEGVHMALLERPDLILMDLMMPVKKGFQACEEIWQDSALSTVPILVLTAFGQDIGETHGLTREHSSGKAVDFLEKPVEINVLLSRIARLIGRSR